MHARPARRTNDHARGSIPNPRSTLYRRAALAASAVSFLGIIPHSIEDFLVGVPGDFGLSTSSAAWLLGIALTVQIGLLLVATSHHTGALVGVVVYGFGWVLAALVDHPEAVMPAPFRDGMSSRVWVLLIVAGQATAAVAAALALLLRQTPDKKS